MSDLERAAIAAARKISRGCDCEYDYRCGRCEAVLGLHEALTALDADNVGMQAAPSTLSR